MINMVYFVELLLQGLSGHVDAERVLDRHSFDWKVPIDVATLHKSSSQRSHRADDEARILP